MGEVQGLHRGLVHTGVTGGCYWSAASGDTAIIPRHNTILQGKERPRTFWLQPDYSPITTRFWVCGRTVIGRRDRMYDVLCMCRNRQMPTESTVVESTTDVKKRKSNVVKSELKRAGTGIRKAAYNSETERQPQTEKSESRRPNTQPFRNTEKSCRVTFS